jgi:hypothetical protein
VVDRRAIVTEPGPLQSRFTAGLDDAGQPGRVELGLEDQRQIDAGCGQAGPGRVYRRFPLVCRHVPQFVLMQLCQTIPGAVDGPAQLLLRHLVGSAGLPALAEVEQRPGREALQHVTHDAEQGEKEASVKRPPDVPARSQPATVACQV